MTGLNAPGNKDAVEAILDAGAELMPLPRCTKRHWIWRYNLVTKPSLVSYEKEMVRHVNEWSQ